MQEEPDEKIWKYTNIDRKDVTVDEGDE